MEIILLLNLSVDQLREIKRITFAMLLCMVSKIKQVPRKGFVAVSRENPYIDCSKMKFINFEPFREKCQSKAESESESRSHSSSKSSSRSRSSSQSRSKSTS